ncbi:MAG: class I SAM-dependent methyltransferase [Eubacteriales bacterium]|nr:class I SAM-dependent methyltransferase [Eubacteriales bacterium]
MFIADDWSDYTLIDAGDGEKLERWGDVTLLRPDPQAIWNFSDPSKRALADAVYHRSDKGGGAWEYRRPIPESWTVRWRDLTFLVKPMGFKHTGLFPEQAANWAWIREKITASGREQVRVLNLFGYTGGATVAAAAAGAEVCHVDASKGMVAQAKINMNLSGLSDRPVRYIVDDCMKFAAREERRGKTYDAVIMDPPSYGRGANGEVWKLEEGLMPLMAQCVRLLSEKPLFFLINSYTTGLQPTVLKNILTDMLARRFGGTVTADEVCPPIRTGLMLPCGASGRWEA